MTDLEKWKEFLTANNIPFVVDHKESVNLQSIEVGVTKNYDEEWDTPRYQEYFAVEKGSGSEVSLDIDFDMAGKFLSFDPSRYD